MRVFIAVNLSEKAKKEIKKLYKKLYKKNWSVKWTDPENLHITLAFPGKVNKDKVRLVKQACQISRRGFSAFELSFKGLGCFPDYDWVRIIWLGLKGDLKNLSALRNELRKNLQQKGFLIDHKPFSPHITLGRVKNAGSRERREIGRQLKGLRILDLKTRFLVDKVIVYQSTCLPTGSVYKKLAQVSLQK